ASRSSGSEAVSVCSSSADGLEAVLPKAGAGEWGCEDDEDASPADVPITSLVSRDSAVPVSSASASLSFWIFFWCVAVSSPSVLLRVGRLLDQVARRSVERRRLGPRRGDGTRNGFRLTRRGSISHRTARRCVRQHNDRPAQEQPSAPTRLVEIPGLVASHRQA